MSRSAVGALSFNTTRGNVVPVTTQQCWIDTGGSGTRARGTCGWGVLSLDSKRRTAVRGITTSASARANFSRHSRLRRKGNLLVRLRKLHVGQVFLGS